MSKPHAVVVFKIALLPSMHVPPVGAKDDFAGADYAQKRSLTEAISNAIFHLLGKRKMNFH